MGCYYNLYGVIWLQIWLPWSHIPGSGAGRVGGKISHSRISRWSTRIYRVLQTVQVTTSQLNWTVEGQDGKRTKMYICLIYVTLLDQKPTENERNMLTQHSLVWFSICLYSFSKNICQLFVSESICDVLNMQIRRYLLAQDWQIIKWYCVSMLNVSFFMTDKHF